MLITIYLGGGIVVVEPVVIVGDLNLTSTNISVQSKFVSLGRERHDATHTSYMVRLTINGTILIVSSSLVSSQGQLVINGNLSLSNAEISSDINSSPIQVPLLFF